MANVLITKRIQVDKETRTMIISAAVAAFIVMFCIFSAHSLVDVLSYQNRVINKQSAAKSMLDTDIAAVTQLDNSYSQFNNTSGNNLLGQPASGTGPNQGDNSKLILDSLPSALDYPAVVVSMQNLISSTQGVTLTSLNVTNVGLTSTAAATTTNPSPVSSANPVPIAFTVNGPLSNIESLIANIQKSTMPIQFLTINLSGSQNNITMAATAQTYYQPATSFNITTQVVQ